MEKKEYIAPTLTAVSFRVERGYALSGGFGPQNAFLGLIGMQADMDAGYNEQGQENWHESDYFGNDW